MEKEKPIIIKQIVFEHRDADPWLDEMEESQRKKLTDFVNEIIVIKKGFVYESKKYGTGATFLFEHQGKDYYSTEFGNAIVRQFEDNILPVLDSGCAVELKVTKRKSKKFGTDYLAFDNAKEEVE